MDVNALGLLVGGTVLLSVIFLIGLCLDCMRQTSSPSIITEVPNGDYIQQSPFYVSRPGTQAYSTNQPLSPRLDQAPSPSPVMRPGCSKQSINDQSSECEYINQGDDEVATSEYIIVIPDACPSQSAQSLCQSQGQESANEYINLKDSLETQEKSDCDTESDGENYINVSPSGATAASPDDDGKQLTPSFSHAGSVASLDSDKSDGAYVNVQPVPGQPIYGTDY